MNTLLYRPVGLKELQLIIDVEFKAFPPRLEWQPIFYPVLNREYAKQIASRWNTQDSSSGYCGIVTEFEIPTSYLEKYEVRNVGGDIHNELWIPAEELDEFNKQIISGIRVIDVFTGPLFDYTKNDEASLLVINHYKKSKRMNNNRNIRSQKAKETLDIIEQGYYLVNGNKVDISAEIEESVNQTLLYAPDTFDTISIRIKDELEKRNFSTNISVRNCTSMEAAEALISKEGRNACLNFASAKNPGGGFLGGAQAQEESLARASALYPTLTKYYSEMYEFNRSQSTFLYSDYMIYSPDVPFFKNDADELLPNPYPLDILTSPAVNISAMKNRRPEEMKMAEATMMARMDKIFSLFVLHNAENLILGAWGCGVFQNNPVDVARYFAYYLKENGKYSKCFNNILFAVFDRSKDSKNIQAFENIFG